MDMVRFEKIRKADDKTISNFSTRDEMFRAFEYMYWIEDEVRKPNGYDKTDIRYTKDPSARNDVTGMHRLLKTTKPQFKVECKDKNYASHIEQALDAWWKASCDVKRANVHSDLALSAVLFSDVNLQVSAVDDLMEIKGIPATEKNRLKDIRRRTPFIFEAAASQMCYPVFGDYGLISHLRKYKARGDAIQARWGVKDLDEDKEYTVRDHYDLEWRCVYIEEEAAPIIIEKHEMPYIPVVSSVSDGTEIFAEEHKKRQPFLYARWKSGLNERSDELLTTLFTSTYSRGTGPLLGIDPAGLQDNAVEVNYAGIVRYIIGKVTPINDKAYDSDLLRMKELLDNMGADSTIYKQTLGQSSGGGQTPFSSLAMMSQAGRLPLVPPQEAVAKVIKEAAMIALKMFREDVMVWEGLKPTEISDDFDLTVTLEVNLPQDTFRNAQVAGQLRGIVSKEWTRQNLLQIENSDEMDATIYSEMAAEETFKQLIPQLVPELFKMFGVGQQAQPQPGGQAQPPQPGGAPQPDAMADGTDPMAKMAGGESMPMTEPMQNQEGDYGRA